MIIRSSHFLWLMFTLHLVTHQGKCGSCDIVNINKINDICTAQINCQNDVDFDVKTWDCIKKSKQVENYEYDRYRYVWKTETTYDDKYYLYINIERPRQTSSLLRNENHYLKLILKEGNIVSIPEEIFKMENLRELSISGNNIPTVNLNKFVSLSHLNKIVLKNNTIQYIEVFQESELLSGLISNVKEIDMSKNVLENLPNNFAAKFSMLRHLDLSYNMINNIGLLTFEGIVQLQTLDLSFNRLLDIGYALARFTSLTVLSISHNKITTLNKHHFETLLNLEQLNVSSNVISNIDNKTFQGLTKLETVDLRYNRIKIVSNYLFSSKTYLNTVLLSDNIITAIEENSFKDTNITEFSINNNPLQGALQQNTFKGVNIVDLNLSMGNLTSIKDMAFANMENMNNLNLSCNSISNLYFSAFSSLVSLKTLDLSRNKLKNLYIDSQSLQNLTHLYIHHNDIGKLISSVFKNMVSLQEIDMSYNTLREIESHPFSKLNNVTRLNLQKSLFVSTLERRTFEGLVSLNGLDMSESNITRFANESFFGLNSLRVLNYTFGQLKDIEFNAYMGTGQLQKLHLSNNKLLYFNINASTIESIEEIYLYNNFIATVPSETFSQLKLLRVLDMANNKIIKLDSDVFRNAKSLAYLDLSSNTNMIVIGNPFQNLSKLYRLSLHNVEKEISFENSTASMETLNLQTCKIRNINKIAVYNIQGLAYLNLSMNEITFIDKDSFRKLYTLVSLDLSFNKISIIQPGSFKHVTGLTLLNLCANNLATIQFGVFDGIEYLSQLNISRNILTQFDVKLLPNISRLSLDDNLISELNFEKFFETHISELSVGGNQIQCQALAELKTSKYSDKFKRIVTTNAIDYHSENVNGITCQTAINLTTSANNKTNIVLNNVNMSPLISTLRNVIERLGFTLQAITENTNATNDLKINEGYVLQYLQNMIESNNKTHSTNGEYLSKLTKISNDSNKNLEDIKKYIINMVESNKNKKELDHGATVKSPIDDQNLRSEFQRMLKLENDALREEFKDALARISKTMPAQQSLVAHKEDTSDTKVVMYFMAVCLAIMLAVYVGNIVFKQVLTSRRSHTNHSRTAISNSIEMD